MQEMKADVGVEWDPVRAERLAFLQACGKWRKGGCSSGKARSKSRGVTDVFPSIQFWVVCSGTKEVASIRHVVVGTPKNYWSLQCETN